MMMMKVPSGMSNADNIQNAIAVPLITLSACSRDVIAVNHADFDLSTNFGSIGGTLPCSQEVVVASPWTYEQKIQESPATSANLEVLPARQARRRGNHPALVVS
jgi:hypothetical protein